MADIVAGAQPDARVASADDRWPVLSSLRFLLALCVVITHAGILDPSASLFKALGQTGFPAVFCFFMISGYSIAASITKNSEGYIARRIRRIYPVLSFSLLFCVAITLFGSIALPSGQLLPAPSLALVAGNFLMLQSIFCPSIPQDGALWSLSIEWWLYMLAPLLIRIDNRFTVLLGIISFSAMCLIFKENVLPDPGVHRIYLYLLAWPWLFGFAYFRNPASILNAILLFIPPLIFFEMFIHLHLASILLVVTAMSLHFAPRFRIGGETVKRVMNWSGDASFPLYLMHGPLLFALTSFTPIRNGNVLVGVVLLLVCVGYWCSRRGWSLIAASSSVPTASFWRRYRPARATVVAP